MARLQATQRNYMRERVQSALREAKDRVEAQWFNDHPNPDPPEVPANLIAACEKYNKLYRAFEKKVAQNGWALEGCRGSIQKAYRDRYRYTDNRHLPKGLRFKLSQLNKIATESDDAIMLADADGALAVLQSTLDKLTNIR